MSKQREQKLSVVVVVIVAMFAAAAAWFYAMDDGRTDERMQQNVRDGAGRVP